MAKLKIKKGDTVKVLAGKNKGEVAEVIEVKPKLGKVKVKGVAIATSHKKPTQASAGGIVKSEAFIDVSNVSFCQKDTGVVSKIGYKYDESGKKVRFLKKTGEVV